MSRWVLLLCQEGRTLTRTTGSSSCHYQYHHHLHQRHHDHHSQEGLRIQCVLMVNAKLEPSSLPNTTLQLDISKNDLKSIQNNFFMKVTASEILETYKLTPPR